MELGLTIKEAARDIEIIDEVDVLVAGAGMAGTAAAVAAARAGAKVVLVEREGVLGGVATATLMSSIGNMVLTDSGELIVRGLVKELVDRLVKHGAVSPDWMNRDVPGITLDSEYLKVVMAEMAMESGVKVITHAVAASPILEGNVVKGAIIESKAGRQAILAKVTIDCTGDGDLAALAGAPHSTSVLHGNASLLFRMERADLDELYLHFRRHPETFPAWCDNVVDFAQFERAWLDHGVWFFPHWGGKKWDLMQDAIKRGEFVADQGIVKHLDIVGMYARRGNGSVVINSNQVKIDTSKFDAADLSLRELKLQQSCFYVADFLKSHIPGFQESFVSQIGHAMGIRGSRWIQGETTLTDDEVNASDGSPALRPDAIGCMPCRDDQGTSGWWFRGYTFDIPFGCMIPKRVENLLVASGKSVSTSPEGNIRGMSYCMVCGQGAGVAAALASKEGQVVRNIDIKQLQRNLIEQGVNLGDKATLAVRGLA